jgi:uncharacterized protein (TIGR02569 family)
MTGPGTDVLVAYALTGAPQPLPGGRGVAWRVADIVLKPVEDLEEHAWVSKVFDTWPTDRGIRVPRPLRTRDGSWSAHGWSAHQWVEGTHLRPGDDPRAFRVAAERFHAVTADLDRPAFLDRRTDPWSVGDRVAWEGVEPVGSGPVRALLDHVIAQLRPVGLAAQIVHGDLPGNVLLSAAGPAVIDWPPYHRPPGWALAVAAVDAVCWQDAPVSLLDDWADEPRWPDLLLRALAYRLATRAAVAQDGALPEARICELIVGGRA